MRALQRLDCLLGGARERVAPGRAEPERPQVRVQLLHVATGLRAGHVPPARGCGCGIYAAREAEEAAWYLEGRGWEDRLGVQRVIGTVSLWGRIFECARGWRASHAYPKTIYVPARQGPYRLRAEQTQEVALALTDYQVTVELLDADSRGPDDIVAALGPAATRG
jgi:hypothetical protein